MVLVSRPSEGRDPNLLRGQTNIGKMGEPLLEFVSRHQTPGRNSIAILRMIPKSCPKVI